MKKVSERPSAILLPSEYILVSLADPFLTLRGEIRVWSLLIDRFVSFPTVFPGELYLECIAYESVRFPWYTELIRTFVTRQVLLVAMDLKSVIHSTAEEYGYQLRYKPEESILAFTGGMDVFVSLPTGYGKSLCYTLLPPIYDKIRKVDRKSIILVVKGNFSYLFG